MQWYAETPARRGRQVAADLAVLAWVVGWVLVGRGVFALVRTLAAPAAPLQQAGSTWTGELEDVADTVVDVPLVGDRLQSPFQGAAGAGDWLVSAGTGLDEGVTRLAWLLALVVAGFPIVAVAGLYLVVRWRSARRLGALARVRDSVSDQQLLALRALVHQPPRVLAALGPDPLGGWRRDDPEVVAALAALELRRAGLRPVPLAR